MNSLYFSPSKSKQTITIALLRSISVAWLLLLQVVSMHVEACIESERVALLRLKQGLSDPSHRLSSWTGKGCCLWTGITCSNLSGRAIKLDLRNLEPYTVSVFGGKQLDKSMAVAGKLDESLAELKHLQYLDLSYNDFQGSRIPEFIGSFSALRYLNLSSAGFSGIIPHSIGNLSGLQTLDLSSAPHGEEGPSLQVDRAHWLSRLTSLKYLDLSQANLADVTGWLRALNMLPWLLELRLSGCALNYNQLSSSSISLPHANFTSLSVLDLSNNYIISPLPQWFFDLSKLRYLYLNSNGFHGRIPASIGNLTSLRALDFSGNPQLDPNLPTTLGDLCDLHTLFLSGLNLGQVSARTKRVFSGCIKHSLRDLYLSETSLQGRLPRWLAGLKSLKTIDLSSNQINSTMPPWSFNLTTISYLDLSYNDLRGVISPLISGMVSLEAIFLQGNSHLDARMPWNLADSCKLQILSLSGLNISQDFAEYGAIFSGCIANSLQQLHLDENSFTGSIPEEIGNLKNLWFLDLRQNSLHGSIPASIGNLSRLRFLSLSDNKLTGVIPESIGQLSELVELDLDDNRFEGLVSEAHFEGLTKLKSLDVESNSLIFQISPTWIPPFQLEHLILSSCKVGPLFPAWLQTQDSMVQLEMSGSGISDAMPDWFWGRMPSVLTLDLSRNEITGVLPLSLNINATASYIDLSSNILEGPVPLIPSNAKVFDLSNNSFSGSIVSRINKTMPYLLLLSLSRNNITGEIPSAICGLKNPAAVDLSRNRLSGSLPSCWKEDSNFQVLDFSNNNISGKIADSLCSLPLKSLHLSHNELSGPFPPSLKNNNNMMLVTLNLGNNKLTGRIPNWIAQGMPGLKILSLKGNSFSGPIPLQLSHLVQLHILDLSHNNLSGTIPKEFGNFSAMTMADTMDRYTAGDTLSRYKENMLIVIKGKEQRYEGIISLVNIIDLSGNYLSGGIPNELTNLTGLQSLNLSSNHLTGEIIDAIGEMRGLESLDLSRNNFSGVIPTTLADLSFLVHLNVSYNKLSGRIPTGRQFNTFLNPYIYIGNIRLCGLPLTNNCSGDEEKRSELRNNDEDEHEMRWLFIGTASGFVVGLWIVFVTLLFKKTWRIAYFRCSQNMYDRLYVTVAVSLNRMKRKIEI